ncbi:MAG: type I methionyl aminopeptidase [Proteobacteria bacterium]|nr:type I methionyl aminopeptidase [Pseudomonadota bacterium]
MNVHETQGPEAAEAEVQIRTGQLRLHRAEDFEGMRRAGRLVAELLDMLAPLVKPGVLTDDLDRLAYEFTMDHGAVPACLFYRGYGRTTCISVNHVVCHGVPGGRSNLVLREGDIANIDATVKLDGWHGDSSRMYPVGQVAPRAQRLLDITHECLTRGVAAVKPGARFSDIGQAIQSYAHAHRCSVVEDFCGHGIGRLFHDAPSVLHYDASASREPGARSQANIEMRPGMFFTIEPMINLGRKEVKVLNDGWTAVTRDKSLSAQYEHSVGVTEDGVEVFTYSPAGLDKPGSRP